jgi:DNA-binding CsgD family transcriptional regulator
MEQTQSVDIRPSEKRHKKRLRAAIESLGPTRTDLDSNALRRLRDTKQALILIDESNALVSCTSTDGFRAIGAGWAFDQGGAKLSKQLASVVRCARDEWFADDDANDVITIHRGKHVVSIVRLRGLGRGQIVISFQTLARRATLRDEALRYDLTPREYEVLRLALGGFSAAEIATRLAIAETTAQVYLKRLLQKTNSRNRAQMVATVLGSRMSHDTDVQDVIGPPPEPVVH